MASSSTALVERWQATSVGSTSAGYSSLTPQLWLAASAGDSSPTVTRQGITAVSTGVTGVTTAFMLPQSMPFPIATGRGLDTAVSSATLPGITAASTGAFVDVTAPGASIGVLSYIAPAGTGLVGLLGTSITSRRGVTAAGFGGTYAIGASVQALPAWIAASRGFLGTGATYSAIVMHMQHAALTTYDNYSFNSFARFNGQMLAAGPNGLFTLDGDTDDGAQIDASFRMGITDFGTSHRKRLERVYIGCRTTGGLVFRVLLDSKIYDYRVRGNGQPGVRGSHVRLGRGLEGRYWQLELRNSAGTDFAIDMIECKVIGLDRRVGGADA